MIIPHHHQHHLHHHNLSLPLPSLRYVHAHLLKLGLLHLPHPSASLPNRLHELPAENTFIHNILLSSLLNSGLLSSARQLFDKMPQRDTVTWNSLASAYSRFGLPNETLHTLRRMRSLGFFPTAFTFSIAARSALTPFHAREVHASATRTGFALHNTVVANALVAMYGRVGMLGYARRVFRRMELPDVVSWNTMIFVFCSAGLRDRALECLLEMRGGGFSIDGFSLSAAISACADGEELAKGEQLLACCFKMGFLSNSIVSSAVIDMYSKCGRLGDSVRLFREMGWWDSAICNSVVSAYARNWLMTEAFGLFREAVRDEIRPTEFTFASILSSSSCFGLAEQGTHVHCYVVKLGLEEDTIVASALVDMYMKLGMVESALRIFAAMGSKDLISCNTVIFGLAQNGQAMTALRLFEQMIASGPRPDRITLVAVLSACSYEGLVREGKSIFASVEKNGIERNLEHYACMVDMMCRAGRLREALGIIETMPHKPTASVWELLLEACRIHGDLRSAEIVAKEVMKLDPRFALPYAMLARIYGTKGRWESVARVWKTMNDRGVKKISGCSWIGIKSRVYNFKDDSILHCGGEATYSVLRTLLCEMEGEGYIPDEDAVFENG